MKDGIRVLFAAAEVVPYAKVGGLADVAGALPKSLEQLGLDVRVIMPLYGSISKKKMGLQRVTEPAVLSIPIAGEDREVSFWQALLPESKVTIYFVDNEHFFGRPGIYADPKTGQGFEDNALRFAFFDRAVLELAKSLDWKPQIIHGNDFHCGLIPAYLRAVYHEEPILAAIRTIYSIHNLAYQGRFPMELFSQLGLPARLARPMEALEFYGEINYMKAGLVISDVINTVSERYAQEIQESAEFGVGLEGILRSRRADLFGILNGVDYSQWNPEGDQLIAANFQRADLSGKKKNKTALLKAFKLPASRRSVPLVGMISRLADQKGFDLILEAAEEIMALDLQLVILGTGQEEYHRQLKALQKRYPKKVSLSLAFDNRLAHQIEAGADMFLMPSRYEPCGLNQMYSLRYGTIPIVRETGGLADTIRDVHENPQEGNGFVFRDYLSAEMLAALRRAVQYFADCDRWKELMGRAMEANFSWTRSAEKYRQLYLRALEK